MGNMDLRTSFGLKIVNVQFHSKRAYNIPHKKVPPYTTIRRGKSKNLVTDKSGIERGQTLHLILSIFFVEKIPFSSIVEILGEII